jgi:DNA-directed RNA polymerase subunit E'/Rpb7
MNIRYTEYRAYTCQMLHDKVYETTVNVTNPINFCADMDAHLMAELRSQYNGRCFKGAFIVRVDEILRRSGCNVVTADTSGDGYIDVQFRAIVVVFSRWDILVGVTILTCQQFVNGLYTRETEAGTVRAAVNILSTRATASLAVGNRVAVRISKVSHNPRADLVNIAGVVFACETASPTYSLHDSLGASARPQLAVLVSAIEHELKRRADICSSSIAKTKLWFFESLLNTYPLPEDRKVDSTVIGIDGKVIWSGPPDVQPCADARNVLDIARRVVQGETVNVTGIWCRPLGLYRSSPLAAVALVDDKSSAGESTADIESKSSSYIESKASIVITEFLKTTHDFLVATRQMTEVYATQEMIDKHRALWGAMRAQQSPLPK